MSAGGAAAKRTNRNSINVDTGIPHQKTEKGRGTPDLTNTEYLKDAVPVARAPASPHAPCASPVPTELGRRP